MNQYEMLRRVSRTFALSIEQLPQILRDSITVSYLLLRVSDCLEDNDVMQAEHKAELLRLWAQVLSETAPVERLTHKLADLDGTDPEVYVAQNAEVLVEQLHKLTAEIQQAIVERVNRTSLGMARWQEHGPYVDNEDEMDDYMHQVAGRVLGAEQHAAERTVDEEECLVDVVAAGEALELDVGADLEAVVQRDRRQKVDFRVLLRVDAVVIVADDTRDVRRRPGRILFHIAADLDFPIDGLSGSCEGARECNGAGAQECFLHDVPLRWSHVC